MKIELKSIKFSEAMSEETNAFTADVFINGKKVAYCKNNGHGGCTDYNSYKPEDRKTIAEAEAYCEALPKIEYGGMKLDQNLEFVIDQLLDDWLKEKDLKKFERKFNKVMSTSIIWGVTNGTAYTYINYKRPLSTIPIIILQNKVDSIVEKHCTDGLVVILNTNLKELGVKY